MWVFILYLCIILLVWTSFVPLINYFLWVYININSFNTVIDATKLVTIVLLIILLPFSYKYYKSDVYVFCILITVSAPIGLVFSQFLVLKFSWVSLFHYLLYILVLNNGLTYHTQFLYWHSNNESYDFICENISFTKINDLYTCNNFFIDKVTVTQTSDSILLNTWNVYYNMNSLNLNSFNLVFNANFYSNIYNLSSNWLSSCLFIETNFLNNILETTVIILIVVLLQCFQTIYLKKQIKY